MLTGTNAIRTPPDLDVLPPGYAPLFARAAEVLAADERVRAVWLSGSLARGDADASSDLDLLVAVADDGFDEFAAMWRIWLEAITPTVIARPLPFLPGSLYSMTPSCERLDIVVERASAIPTSGFRTRVVVFDRDGLDEQLLPEPAPAGADPAKVEQSIEEPLRYLGLLPAVLGRGELMVAQEGYAHMRRRIGELFLAANAPLPTTGVKRFQDKLTPRQHEILLALPWPAADRDELIAANREIAAVLVREGRPIAEQVGVAWPDALEAAVRAHLDRELGLTF